MTQKELKKILIRNAAKLAVFRPTEDYEKLLNEKRDLISIRLDGSSYDYGFGSVLKAIDSIAYKEHSIIYVNGLIEERILFQPDPSEDIYYYVLEVNRLLSRLGYEYRV